MELPKEIDGLVELTKTKGTNKVKLSTKDLNQKSDNFLKKKGLEEINVV